MKKLVLIGQKLSKMELKQVSGGANVSRDEYCSTLATIMTNPKNVKDMSQGACEGAAEGARRAGCGFTINCVY